jgi:hypothetical protein
MSGYTPVFETIYNGTLYGRWPSAAVWASLLPLCDKHGVISYSWAALSSMTGWPMDLLRQGVTELMQPDPGSNSPNEQGKRLVPHEQRDGKDWGWQAVNHLKYREKARKQGSDQRRQESGENAGRMSARKHGDPRGPAKTREDPPSYSDTNAYTNTDKTLEKRAARAPTAKRLPEDFLMSIEREKVAEKEGVSNITREFERFRDYWRAASGAPARKHDWDAAWRNWCRKAADLKPQRRDDFVPERTWRPTDDEANA